jgi:WD40 repeat protein
MLASGSQDRNIILWDVATRKQIGRPLTGHNAYVFSMAFRRDGKALASIGEDGTIIMWDIASHQQLGLPIAGHKGGAGKVTVAFSPDDQMLVSGGCGRSSGAVCEQSEIRLWDVATRQELGVPLIGHKGGITGLVFSPNGKTLASTGNDGTIIFWDISVESWVGRVCGIAHRNLTPGEWRQYLGDEAYRKTCPEL